MIAHYHIKLLKRSKNKGYSNIYIIYTGIKKVLVMVKSIARRIWVFFITVVKGFNVTTKSLFVFIALRQIKVTITLNTCLVCAIEMVKVSLKIKI